MADGEFFMPTRVFFGRGVADQAGARAAGFGATRLMVVTDPEAAGLLHPIRERLTGAGLDPLVFSTVEPNPRDVDCLAGADLARDAKVGAFVAVGGGSPIDSAKCISLLLTNGGHPRDWEDFAALREPPLPILAIPDDRRTGSEVSPSAVITDTERKKKMNLFDMSWIFSETRRSRTRQRRRIPAPPTPPRSGECSLRSWIGPRGPRACNR